ncbi:MAG: hypothetical protein II771_01320 [Clostridia bacterium]|nr:hypothetical protein [Clostridia bacterium]
MVGTILFLVFLTAFLLCGLLFPRKRGTKRFCALLAVAALVSEIFFFHFHSFHLLFGGYERTEIPLSSLAVSGAGERPYASRENGSALTLTLPDAGRRVGTVALSCSFAEGADSLEVKISASDDSNAASLRQNVASGTVLRGNDQSSVIVLDLTGKVRTLRITLSCPQQRGFEVTALTLNRPVPFSLSPVRLVFFLALMTALYALFAFPSMRESYENAKILFLRAAGAMTALLIAGAFLLTVLRNLNAAGAPFSSPAQTSGNQITEELVDAFEAGQVSLLDEVPEELLRLDNPYDWSERLQKNVSYKWDHLLYEGKYYSYYGIAPVFLLFLPYHLLTGFYFPTPPAVFLFGGAGILFLSLLFCEVVRLFGRRMPVGLLLSSLAVLQFSSGVWYNFLSPLFYEIAQASGFCFTAAGLWLLLRSGVADGQGRIRLPSLALSTTCLALAVLCRPTLAVYCVASLFFLALGLARRRKTVAAAGGKVRRATVSFLAASLLPYVLLGGAQMLYNHARFGSFFDFGIQYSLTINDFTRSEYHTDFVLIGLFNFLFAAPILKPEFPWFFSNFSTLNTNGYYFVANRNAIGLFFRALPVWGYAAVRPAWKSLLPEERRRALLLGLPTCLVCPLVVICSIWESGYGVRYACDFAAEFILGGMLLLWLIYQRRAERQTKKLLYGAFVLSALVAFAVNGAMIWDYLSKDGSLRLFFLSLARAFSPV